MLNISVKEFEVMLAQSDVKIKNLKSKFSVVQRAIGRLNLKKIKAEEQISDLVEKSEAIRKALILVKGVPSNISKKRGSLLYRILKERETDSISKKSKLRTEITILKGELQRTCPHPFVFHKDGFIGTPSKEYENGYPSERYCLVCSLEEKAKDFRQNGRVDMVGTVFETLKDSESRVICREPYRPHPQCLSKMDIWMPLGAALRPMEEMIVKTLNS